MCFVQKCQGVFKEYIIAHEDISQQQRQIIVSTRLDRISVPSW